MYGIFLFACVPIATLYESQSSKNEEFIFVNTSITKN